MGLTHVNPKRWTVEEYERLFELGFLDPEGRYELIEGEIVPMAPQDYPHANSVMRATNYLVGKYGATHYVRVQLPLRLSDNSQPEPDFALVPMSMIGPSSPHPTTADLVIEIADSSLAYDRSEKASVYAKCGIGEVWVLDVRSRTLHIHREPTADAEQPFGFHYASVRRADEGETVKAMFRPDVSIEVLALL